MYVDNNFNTQSTFDYVTIPLSKNMLQHQSFRVEPTHVKFQKLLFYSDPLIQSFDEFDVYDAKRDGTWTYAMQDRDAKSIPRIESSYASIQFH